MRLSVVICTYERPALLAALLRSLAGQEGAVPEDVEILVVDNSDGGSARPVVEALAAGSPFPLRYLVAHPANISVARNAGCRASRGAAIAFLDDDQEAEPGWLRAVLDGLVRSSHDVFFGPITPRYEDPADVPPPPGPSSPARATRRPGTTCSSSTARPARASSSRPPTASSGGTRPSRAPSRSIRISGSAEARISTCSAASPGRESGSAGYRTRGRPTSCPTTAAAPPTSCAAISRGAKPMRPPSSARAPRPAGRRRDGVEGSGADRPASRFGSGHAPAGGPRPQFRHPRGGDRRQADVATALPALSQRGEIPCPGCRQLSLPRAPTRFAQQLREANR